MSPDQPAAAATADGLVAAGLAAHRAGRLGDADALYARALRTDPRHADALNLAGAVAFAQRRHADAVRLIGKAVRERPDHLDAHLNLAEAQAAAGQPAEALATLGRLLAAAPDHAEAHARAALLRAEAGSATLALAHARVALALDAGQVEALCARALASRQLRRIADADAAWLAALALAPDDLRALTGRIALLRDSERIDEALAVARHAVAVDPRNPGLLGTLAALLELEGDVDAALALLDRAIAIDPDMAELLFSRGRCLRDSGHFDAAADVFEDIAKRHPSYAPALLALARMKRLSDTPERRRAMTRLAGDAALPPRHRVQAGFALGDLLDRAGDHDLAFRHFTAANALHRKQRVDTGDRFDRAELTMQIDLTAERLAVEYARDTGGWANSSDLPVFVVGLPRSGTTLVEQICASHSQVAGLGELRLVHMAARRIAARNEGRLHIGEWDASHARGEADALVAAMTARAGNARRAVDKTPLNLMRLGTIAALVPNARVIRCRRDPRDVVVSNHTMYFGHGNLWSTDQADCAFAVREIERLGDVWQATLPLPVLDLVYEDLVADLEGQVRRIIDFLGLDWEPQCLDFHRTERHVDTPSSWQVRQPIYTGSVGRWRRFEAHLGPMLAALRSSD